MTCLIEHSEQVQVHGVFGELIPFQLAQATCYHKRQKCCNDPENGSDEAVQCDSEWPFRHLFAVVLEHGPHQEQE